MTLDEKIFAAYLEKFTSSTELKQKLQFNAFFSVCHTLYSVHVQRGELVAINDAQTLDLWDCKLGFNLSIANELNLTYKELDFINGRHQGLNSRQIKIYGYMVRLAKCKYFIDFIFED